MAINENGVQVERQYIGARYVPKFFEGSGGSPEWVSGLAYEALTIVTYLGNSFTSKIPVPAGIGNPADNPTYWVNTGNYNAQVDAYRKEVEEVKNDILGVNSTIETLSGNVTKISKSTYLNPINFGAVGDGVTDDTAAVKLCIETAINQKTGVLITHEHLIKEPIIINNSIVIQGCGGCLIDYGIRLNTSDRYNCGVLTLSNTSNCIIKDLCFKGPGALIETYNMSASIEAVNSTNILIDNCIILNSPSIAAILVYESNFVTVSNCLIKEYTYSGISFGNGSSFCTARDNYVINGNYSPSNNTTPDRYGIVIAGSSQNPTPPEFISSNNKAINNYLEDNSGVWTGIDAHGGNYLEVIGNTVKNFKIGISIYTDTNRGFSVYHAIVANNIVECLYTKTNPEKNYLTLSYFAGNNITVIGNSFLVSGYPKELTDAQFRPLIIGYCTYLIFKSNMIYGGPGAFIELKNDINTAEFSNCSFGSLGGYTLRGIFVRRGASYSGIFITNNNFGGLNILLSDITPPTTSFVYILKNCCRSQNVSYSTVGVCCDMSTTALINQTLACKNAICVNTNYKENEPLMWVGTGDNIGNWTPINA